MAASITRLSTGDPSIAARYLADQLSEQERLAFEEQMVTDPAVLREVEATARFKAGLAHLRDTGELATLPESRQAYVPWLAAAVVVMAVGIGLLRPGGGAEPWIAASLQALSGQNGVTLSAGRQYTLLRLRSEGQTDAVIDLPPQGQVLELRVLPDVGDARSRYRATLSRLDTAFLKAGSTPVVGLIPDGNGYLTLFADSTRLKAGRYRLVLQLEAVPDDAAAAGEFLIELRTGESGP